MTPTYEWAACSFLHQAKEFGFSNKKYVMKKIKKREFKHQVPITQKEVKKDDVREKALGDY